MCQLLKLSKYINLMAERPLKIHFFNQSGQMMKALLTLLCDTNRVILLALLTQIRTITGSNH